METYEQKYNIALDWARKVYPHTCGKEKEDLERVFPDLKESEDERIRKHLLTHFKNKTKETWCCMPVKDIVAWLEKQKEQKPAEWSEEDLQHKSWILECLADGEKKMPEYAEDFQAAYKWLKSLRPRPRWKPSEEQVSILGKIFAGCELNTSERDSMVDLFYHIKDMI